MIRESAIRWLCRHLDDGTAAKVRMLAEHDPSRAVRIIAADVLEEAAVPEVTREGGG